MKAFWRWRKGDDLLQTVLEKNNMLVWEMSIMGKKLILI
jgi:hypothetical protein